MAIVTTDDLIAQLNIFGDLTDQDTALIAAKIPAAQGHIERLLGFRIEDTFGGAGQEPVPPSLKEAVIQLAAWWFEQREAVLIGVSATEIPFGVRELVDAYREWSF